MEFSMDVNGLTDFSFLILLKESSLWPPWGRCDKLAIPYHTCMGNCRNLKAAKLCNCSDVYMTDLVGGN